MDQKLLAHLKEITEEEQAILDGSHAINPSLYNLEHSMTIDSRKLLEHGKLIQVRPHTRFVHFPKHNHNYVEVIYMCSGHTTHIINGVRIDLKAGELLFLNQNATQEIYPAKYDDVAVNFIILPEFFDTPLMMLGSEDSMLRTFLIDCLKNKNQDIDYLHFKVSDILPIQNLVENLIWTLQYGLPNKRSVNQTTMGLLFLHLTSHVNKMDLGHDHLEQGLMFQVFQYIEENYRDGSLTALSENLGYELSWLSRLIKKQTGKNYKELLQAKRLKQAAYLLTETSLSITDISLHVGYNNFSYFYRIFKTEYGLSPNQYRKS